jgi:hypothetical protein
MRWRALFVLDLGQGPAPLDGIEFWLRVSEGIAAQETPMTDTQPSPSSRPEATFFGFEPQRLEQAQKELLAVCEEAGRAWGGRLQSEVNLWSETMAKLSVTRSLPEFWDTYAKCMTRRMEMAMEDTKKLVEECNEATQKVVKAFGVNNRLGSLGSSD